MLGVFLLATQLAPLAHLATHRAGHTHGPRLAAFDELDHDAAHRLGQPHAHDAAGREASLPWGNEHADADQGADDPARRSGGVPDRDHGRESISHFGLALNEGPPPPVVPAPAETIAAPLDARPRAQHWTGHPQPPTRGPPDSTRLPHSIL